MLKLLGIHKHYINGDVTTRVLNGVDLQVGEGDFITIMGPSGSGKSTLLHIMGMLDEPTSGEYYFLGKAVHDLSEKQRTRLHRDYIGIVFQAYHLIDELTVYENLETPLLYKKIKSAERKGMVADMLDRFNIVAKKDLFPSQLSGGQQQMVGVARALITSPKLLLADEPTGNLNSEEGARIMNLFRSLNEDGVTIIQVTHSERNASYGRQTINILDGKITDMVRV
jgi:putative ABC transport system ATP-binding protein